MKLMDNTEAFIGDFFLGDGKNTVPLLCKYQEDGSVILFIEADPNEGDKSGMDVLGLIPADAVRMIYVTAFQVRIEGEVLQHKLKQIEQQYERTFWHKKN